MQGGHCPHLRIVPPQDFASVLTDAWRQFMASPRMQVNCYRATERLLKPWTKATYLTLTNRFADRRTRCSWRTPVRWIASRTFRMQMLHSRLLYRPQAPSARLRCNSSKPLGVPYRIAPPAQVWTAYGQHLRGTCITARPHAITRSLMANKSLHRLPRSLQFSRGAHRGPKRHRYNLRSTLCILSWYGDSSSWQDSHIATSRILRKAYVDGAPSICKGAVSEFLGFLKKWRGRRDSNSRPLS